MKRAGLLIVILFIGISLSFVDCAYAGKSRVVVSGEDEDSERAFLGIYMSDIPEETIEDEGYPYSSGVLIMDVIDDSPAEEAGLETDDIIYIFDGSVVDDTKGLSRMVSEKSPGDRVEIVFFRGGDRKRVDVKLTGRKYNSHIVDYDWDEYAEKMGKMGRRIGRSVGGVVDRYFRRNSIEGLELSDLDKDMAGYFDVDEDEGILVTGVKEGSSADKAGIKSGDIIVEINGKEIKSLEGYHKLLRDCREGFKMIILRRGEKKEFHFTPEDIGDESCFEIPEKKIYKLEIPGEEQDFRIITKECIDLEDKLEDLESLNKKIAILKGKTEKSLQKNMKDIEKRIKDIEDRLKELEDK
ncbi:MAG TPA: PDZ domain-containing protein [Candidatus Krumholzibacteriaceae bacterium]|nr:PDZ domain-containing protein [Candidatus Krumholzibacteriaceae bacterium]